MFQPINLLPPVFCWSKCNSVSLWDWTSIFVYEKLSCWLARIRAGISISLHARLSTFKARWPTVQRNGNSSLRGKEATRKWKLADYFWEQKTIKYAQMGIMVVHIFSQFNDPKASKLSSWVLLPSAQTQGFKSCSTSLTGHHIIESRRKWEFLGFPRAIFNELILLMWAYQYS